jgi:acetyltransferase-like isoleucine patch superfamily enzyme
MTPSRRTAMNSPMPNVILGFSGSLLPSLLESMLSNGASGEVLVVENIVADDDWHFQPAGPLRARRIWIDFWQFAPSRDRLVFCMRGVKGKTGVFKAFEAQKGVAREHFGVLRSQLVTIASTARVSPGCYFEPMVVVAPYARLGFGVCVNRGATIGHHTTIGEFSTINPGCHVAGHCQIGERVTIGIGAVVFDHVAIGDGSIVGGGSVVTKDVPPGALAYGSPCRVIRELDAG